MREEPSSTTLTKPSKRRHWGSILLGVSPLLILSYGVLTRPPAAPGDASPRLGQPLPDFTLPDLQGNKVHLVALQGKVVFIDIWPSRHRAFEERPASQRRMMIHGRKHADNRNDKPPIHRQPTPCCPYGGPNLSWWHDDMRHGPPGPQRHVDDGRVLRCTATPLAYLAGRGLCIGRHWRLRGEHTRGVGLPHRYGAHDVDDDAGIAHRSRTDGPGETCYVGA
jgi:hypothetical protein